MNSANEGFTDATSDGGAALKVVVTVGEKRAADSQDEGNDVLKSGIKKTRNGGFGSEEEDMRRIAEIVLVLSAMGMMRGGRDPIGAEKAMMKEARARVLGICQELTPKDIIPREAFNGIIEDLGLNRLKDGKSEFRAPKLSIAEKMEITKKRMVDSESVVSKIASTSAPNPQAAIGSSDENSGIPTPSFATHSEKPSHLPVSSASYQHPLPVRPVSSTASTISFQGHASVSSRFDRPYMRSEGWPGGSSLATQDPAGLETQSASLGNIDVRNQVPNHLSIKPQEGADKLVLQPQATRVQTMKPVITQVVPGSMAPMHRPIQAMHDVQTSHLLNTHQQICKIVQNGLYPKPPEYPVWLPPSREYMNKSLTCQVCQSTINEVENMLVCDACEKGFHLNCLQIGSQKVVPKSDWHCSRCVTINKGKPFHPKYGRVMRNQNAKKITSNFSGLHSPSQKKLGANDHAPNQQQILANVSSSEGNPCVAGTVTKSLEAKVNPGHEMGGTKTSLDIKREDAGGSENIASVTDGTVGSVCLEGCGNPSSHPIMESEPYPTDEISEANEKLHTPSNPLDFDRSLESGAIDQSPSFHAPDQPPDCMNNVNEIGDSRDSVSPGKNAYETEASNGGGVSLPDQEVTNGLTKCVERSNGIQNTNGLPTPEVKQNGIDSVQENQSGQTSANASEGGLHNVDWVGDADEVVDNKKFYQSCCINGWFYAVSDYVLIGSSDGKLAPWKLQAMWEDCQTSTKRMVVSRCYFPGDLPASVGCPASEDNEVYESNHVSTLMAGLIQGPCKVLPIQKFEEENGKNDRATSKKGDQPVFLCRWFYDKIKCVFHPIPS